MAEGRIAGSRMADFPVAVTRHLIFIVPDGRDLGPENVSKELLPGTILINTQPAKLVKQYAVRWIRN
jgi:hypothetical protein